MKSRPMLFASIQGTFPDGSRRHGMVHDTAVKYWITASAGMTGVFGSNNFPQNPLCTLPATAECNGDV